jgi:uncharacterized membrane protein (DUF106 family)
MLLSIVIVLVTAVVIGSLIYVANKVASLFDEESMATLDQMSERMREAVETSTLK